MAYLTTKAERIRCFLIEFLATVIENDDTTVKPIDGDDTYLSIDFIDRSNLTIRFIVENPE